MPPSVITNQNRPPNQGDFIITRRAPASPSENHVELLMVWDVVYVQHEVIVQVMDPGQIIPYLPTEMFVAAGSGREIKNAPSAEAAVAVFRRAIDLDLRHHSNAGRSWQVHPLVAVIGQDSQCFMKPSAEAVRKVLLGDRCPNESCRRGLVAATHRASFYQQVDLPMANPREDKGQMPMLCPVCLPLDVVVENERHIAVAMRLASGGLIDNDEMDGLRRNDKEVTARRLEAGYDKIETYPEVSHGHEVGISGWVVKNPGRWYENVNTLRQRAEIAQTREDQPPTMEPVHHVNDNSEPRSEASRQAATANTSRRLPSLRQIFGKSLPR
ncbi:hypothetical protein PRZ48_008396 [Zasmidium cellare]|uniref:Uncharacterized protein n=1 Tax=Zasmidium cellare TaxID=395010 RepID=A0ABR0EFD8_ZASCE|nr:hypothetical protein PRZ48_008396 [Zasmidium cellare]